MFLQSSLRKQLILRILATYLYKLFTISSFDIPFHCDLSLLVLLFAIMGKSPNVKFLSTKNELHERRLLDLDYLALSEHPIYNPIYIHNEWCGCLVFISFAMSLSSFQLCSRSIPLFEQKNKVLPNFHAWYSLYSTSVIFAVIFENTKWLQEYHRTIRLFIYY